jgi:hypothetical protein
VESVNVPEIFAASDGLRQSLDWAVADESPDRDLLRRVGEIDRELDRVRGLK